MTRVVGLDLAGAPHRDTGFCSMVRGTLMIKTLYSDEDILGEIIGVKPALVIMDAPLSLPRGRRLGKRKDTIVGSRKIHFRQCDLELRRLKIPFFPITLGPMRMLTTRGLRLKAALKRRGIESLEGYPGGAQDLWGISRNKNMKALLRGLRQRGLKGLSPSHTKDELDAATLALLARDFLRSRARTLGDPREGLMVLPGIRRRDAETRRNPLFGT